MPFRDVMQPCLIPICVWTWLVTKGGMCMDVEEVPYHPSQTTPPVSQTTPPVSLLYKPITENLLSPDSDPVPPLTIPLVAISTPPV